MDRRIASPEQLDLESPGRRDYWVAFERDSTWGQWQVPLTVMVGPEAAEGEGLVAFGSNHGNEYEGPTVVKHLVNELDVGQVRGRIILVPVLNPAAFHTGTRDSASEDGVNMNRAFVEGAGEVPSLNGITHRIARFVRQAIWPHVHVVLDLHAGGLIARFARTSSFHPIPDPEQHARIEEMARWFGTPFVVVYGDETPGLLPSEGERLGKITVGCELGWGQGVSPAGVRMGRQGVLAAAIHHGQLSGTISPIDHHADGTQKVVSMVDPAGHTMAPWPGHFEAIHECGVRIEAGETVGLLHDFHRIDEPGLPLVAQVSGYLLCQAWEAPVQQGQLLAVVAQEVGT